MPSAEDQVAALFLSDIHAPQTPDNMRAVKIWLAAENSNPTLRNNPWNLHQGAACGNTGDFCARSVLPGQTGVVNVNASDKNVAVFSSLGAGVQANVNNLTSLSKSNPEYGYGAVITSIQNSDPVGFLTALGNSAWSAGHYQQNGSNSLVKAFNGAIVPGQTTGNNTGTGSTISTDASWTDTLKTATQYPTWNAFFDSIVNTPNGPQNWSAITVALGKLGIKGDTKPTTTDVESVTKLLNDAGVKAAKPGLDILGGIFGSVTGAVIFLGVILVGITFIGTGGLIALRKDK